MTHDSETSSGMALQENSLNKGDNSVSPSLSIGPKVAYLPTTGVTAMFAQKSAYIAEALAVALNAGLAAFSHSKLAPINGLIAIGLIILAIVFNRKRLHIRGFQSHR